MGETAAISKPAPRAGRYKTHATDITVIETEKENAKLHDTVTSCAINLLRTGIRFTEK